MSKDFSIPLIDPDAGNCIDVTNLGLKTFRRMLRHGSEFEVFRLLAFHKMRGMNDYEFNGKLKTLLDKYKKLRS